MKKGLVSVTFRELSPAEIIALAKKSGLDGIEWGADIHCPPDNPDNAKAVAAQMRENGLVTISYGSYYRAGVEGNYDFRDIVNTALLLETDNIRIWTGNISSKDADDKLWHSTVADIRRVADIAANRGITVSFEYHENTLSDGLEVTLRLIRDVDRPNVLTYWQPQSGSLPEDNIRDLKVLADMKLLKNLHVFSWNGKERLPLRAYADRWPLYVEAAKPCNPALLLEFVKEPEQFADDAEYLRTL